MRKLIPMAILALLSGCGDWPMPPDVSAEPASPPLLAPIEAFSPRIDDPNVTAAELQARAAALEARAAEVRSAQP